MEMALVKCVNVAIMLILACSQIHIASSLQCYTCTSLTANNDLFGTFQPNEACATFDSSGAEIVECGTSPLGQEAKCEKWEGTVNINVPLIGDTNISGVIRGCAFVPTGDALNSCVSSTELEGVAQTALNFIASQLFSRDVQGTYCSCDRNYCNGATGLAGARTWAFAALLVFLGRGIQCLFQERH